MTPIKAEEDALRDRSRERRWSLLQFIDEIESVQVDNANLSMMPYDARLFSLVSQMIKTIRSSMKN